MINRNSGVVICEQATMVTVYNVEKFLGDVS